MPLARFEVRPGEVFIPTGVPAAIDRVEGGGGFVGSVAGFLSPQATTNTFVMGPNLTPVRVTPQPITPPISIPTLPFPLIAGDVLAFNSIQPQQPSVCTLDVVNGGVSRAKFAVALDGGPSGPSVVSQVGTRLIPFPEWVVVGTHTV